MRVLAQLVLRELQLVLRAGIVSQLAEPQLLGLWLAQPAVESSALGTGATGVAVGTADRIVVRVGGTGTGVAAGTPDEMVLQLTQTADTEVRLVEPPIPSVSSIR